MAYNDYAWQEYFPHGLTQEDREDPYRIIDALFCAFHLPSLREEFEEMKTALVVGNFKKLSRRERSDMMYLLEKIRKLIEASHVIHKRRKEENTEKEKPWS